MNRRTFAGTLIGATAAAAAPGELRVRVQGRIERLEIEAYTAGVLTGEGSVLGSNEALKALAVAVRTYATRFRGRHAAEGFDLCDTTHCQRYDTAAPGARVIGAARQTAGQLLQHQGKPALTYYTLDCGGHSEDVREAWPGETAAYLTAHADPYCPRTGWHWEIGAAALAETLMKAGLRAPRHIERLAVVERTESGRAKVLVLSGGAETVRVSASSLRFAVGRAHGFQALPGDLYQAGISGNRAVFNGTGSGHGAGLCQRGADRMGAQGRGYREILAFYFPGTEMPALVWRRVAGERLALFTARADRDADALPLAERLLRGLELRSKLIAPRGIELRVYPDMASFIDATGEPGWVAARTTGREIQLQPLSTLREREALESTLRHELAHVLIETNSRAGLPVWFREGLAGHFTGAAPEAGSQTAAPDRDLRQTADEARARAAYESARRQVAALVNRYGETVVVSWLATGLPREVTNASSRQPATNNK